MAFAHSPITAEQLPDRLHLAACRAQELAEQLKELTDDCWADDNTVRLSPPLQELRELIDSVALLQQPLNELSAATDVGG
ncbi:hypothetical protein [Vulcanococcus sp.]|uniref:hypothetical protein n=1 Tax=Vulcanococcus sp. TaxID=2856995 RepID=UPI003BFB4FE4